MVWLFCVIGFSLLGGCGPSSRDLRRHLDAGAFGRAVEIVLGKKRMELHLAVLVIEKHLMEGGPAGLFDVLSTAGKPGRRVLKRLEAKKDGKNSLLASIALRQHEEPEIDDVMLVVNENDSDVRAFCIRAWHLHMTLVILERALMDHDPRVRLHAVKGIAGIGMEQDVSGLLRETLRLDPSSTVRAEVARHGKLLGGDVLLVLKQALGDKSPGVRFAALRGLAETEDATAIEILEDIALGDVDHSSVVAAAELARLGHPTGRIRLEGALEKGSSEIRKGALLRLERAGLPDRIAILKKRLGDEDPGVVLLAARLLQRDEGAGSEVIEALRKIFKGKEQPHSNHARNLLAALGDASSLGEVRKIVTGDNEEEILQVVRQIGDASFLRDEFVGLMAFQSGTVRVEAAKAVVFSRSKI